MKSTIPALNSTDTRLAEGSNLTFATELATESIKTARVFDLGVLQSQLERLTDQRKRRGKRYGLAMLLLLVILAKLSGEDHPAAIADWVANRGRQLRNVLRLDWKRMPHESTFRRLVESMVSPEELDETIFRHLTSQEGVGRSVVISIDGKTSAARSSGASRAANTSWRLIFPKRGLS